MPTFQYNAIRMGDRTKVQGTINAETEREVRELLREQELYPTTVQLLRSANTEQKKKKQEKKQDTVEAWMAEKFSKIGLKEKIAFTQNMGMMIKAGIPLTESLLYMENYMDKNPKFKRMIHTIRMDILAGFSLSKALEKHNETFSDIYINIVSAGEASGELERILKRLSTMLAGEAALKKKVMGAMMYPAIVIVLVVIAMAVMLGFVIPVFAEMYNQMGMKLPMITQVMINLSNFLRNFWYIVIGLIVGGTVFWMKFSKSASGKTIIDQSLLKIPVASSLVYGVCSSNFISTLQVAFAAGLPITDCIFMSCQTITHTQIRALFDQVNLQIQTGQRLATALAETGILPDMVLIMISTGEESGELEEMLEHSLEYLEEEVNARVEVLMSLMEPCLLLFLGVVVGCMALSIYLPLFSMYEQM